MSAGTPGRREVAHRLFATEFDASTFSYSESDEERAPNYVITPTGARVNRLFVVGVLTAVERVNDDVLRARVVDPTGPFVVYASQYQPEALAFLERTDPPAFVAVTGKANTFQPEDSDRVFTSVRPESVNLVDAETRDRWTVQTAAKTLERISLFADTVSRPESNGELPRGVELAHEQYGTTPAYLAAMRDVAFDAARMVTGEVDAVESPSMEPDAVGRTDVTYDDLRSLGIGVERAADDIPGIAADVSTASSETSPTTSAPSTSADATDSVADTASASVSIDHAAVGTDSDSAGRTDADVDGDDATAAGAEPVADDAPAAEVESDGDDALAAEVESDADDISAAEAEPDADGEPAAEVASGTDSGAGDPDAAGGDDEFDYDEDVLDEAERAEVEETYGTEFTTGADVGDPGEAGIDVPDVEELEEALAESETESTTTEDVVDSSSAEDDVDSPGTESEVDSSTTEDAVDSTSDESDATSDSEPGSTTADEPAAAVDLESAVVETMRVLDDGDGAARDAVVEAVREEHGADQDAILEAIQDALMGGRCYEPADDLLKPI